MQLNGFLSGMRPQERSTKKAPMFYHQDCPIFLSAGTYPWRVAPQQSSLPFQFHYAKLKTKNYIYKLLNFAATLPSKHIAKGRSANNPEISGQRAWKILYSAFPWLSISMHKKKRACSPPFNLLPFNQ